MTARRKRSALSKTKAQRGRKQSRSQQADRPENVTMESSRPKQIWLKKKERCWCHDNGGLKAIVPMRSNLPTFQSVERLAEWVFSVAKYRPLKLNLNFCERSEEVRDTLLRQFHRWPEAKIADAAKQFQTLSHVAEEQCQEQVQLYLQELRGKLVGGSNALFWLNVLQPLTHAASVPRPEAREVLMALLQESKSIDGVFEQLVTKSERVLAVLTLPLKLEPLFQGVSGLAQCGYAPAANEAMEMLTMFAEEVTAYPERKKGKLPLGLSVVASVGGLVPLGDSGLSQLPEAFREQLASSFAKMATDWLMVVEEVLDVLEKSLKSRWLACERAPFEEELEEVVQGHLQTAFARLSQALAMDQLYALREMRGERPNADEDCLNVAICRGHGLLIVQPRQEDS